MRLIRALSYRALYRLAHVLLHVGEHNRRCFEDFGGRPGQLVHAPQVVDNARFDAERRRLAPRRDALKLGFGIAADRKVVLFCARFIALKQPSMVVNEAMNFGCPSIISDRVGCAPDLVAGKCGLVFPHDRPDLLVAALRRMCGGDALRAASAPGPAR